MDDKDGKHLAETLRVLGEAEAWAARTSADAARLRPAPGSSLRGDDDQAFPYALSHAVWDALDHAVDHLTCLQALLRDARVIHRFAPYALVRGALENACAAVWMLEPPRRADRLARRLRLAIDDVRNGEQARQLTGQQGPRTRKDRLDDIAAIATRAGLEEEALKNRVSYTEIVKAVDASGVPGSLIEFSWKICSGLTHGDSWAAWSASRMTQMPSPVQDGVATLKMEASLSLLMQMTTLAVRLTGRGWQLHDQRCQSPYLSSAIAACNTLVTFVHDRAEPVPRRRSQEDGTATKLQTQRWIISARGCLS